MEQIVQGRLKCLVGTSGWQYAHWRGIFYPDDLGYKEWLTFYSKHFQTVELNVTFYRNVKSSTFKKWLESVPENFLFSMKLSRQITHFRRLKIDRSMLDSFIDRASSLKEKIGVILIQLPPSFKFDEVLIKDFFSLLDRKYKYAIEVRNKTFINDQFFNILEKENIAFCIADSAGRYPYHEAVTANFIYIRLHGSQRLYASEYSEVELQAWAEKIRFWDKITYIYFDNDFMGYAVKNALRLKELLTF